VQDDREVRRSKGIEPVIPLAERMAIIEALRCVDEVVSYVSVFQGPLLRGLGVDVLAVGEEYGRNDEFPLQRETLAYCREHGIKVVHLPRTRHISSTQIRARLHEFWRSRASLVEALPAGVTVLGSHGGDQQKTRETTARELRLVLEAVESPEKKTLLDLGCGDGRHLAELSKSFAKVIGVDFAGELLEIARKRLVEVGTTAELIECNAVEFTTDQRVDVLLLSGLLPCIDDEQAEQLAANLQQHARRGGQLFVRTSNAVQRRINVVNQFSEELGCHYTAYYRTDEEVVGLFGRHGWRLERGLPLYQHRSDTGVWWYQFRSAAGDARKWRAA
jgi:glycerol-3-phosphate cytidylyltransferase